MHWQSVVDFVVLVVAVYLLLTWSREARALRLALSILALRVGALITRQLDLLITSWVLDGATILALLVLIVGFQPELRRAVMRLDLFGPATPEGQLPVAAAVAVAAAALAAERCGALIVVVQNDSIAELVTGGISVGSHVSSELLEAVFQKGSPIHDGAAIVEGDQLTQAGAILPLTQRPVPEQYGTRHRAGIGLAERSDAIIVVVSEERGEMTLVQEDRVRLMRDQETLLSALKTILAGHSNRKGRRRSPIRPMQFGLAGVACAIAVVVWSATFLLPGTSVRAETVPVEFVDVPLGFTISEQSADTVQVWLRASDFVFDSVNLGGLLVQCSLATAHEGLNMVSVNTNVIDVPPGVRLEGVAPHALRVRLAKVPPGTAGRPD